MLDRHSLNDQMTFRPYNFVLSKLLSDHCLLAFVDSHEPQFEPLLAEVKYVDYRDHLDTYFRFCY